jgi:glycosyltransferase involved in cell wall biosynthesis
VSLIAAYVAKMLNSLMHEKKPVIVVPFYHITPRNASYQKKHIKYLQHANATLSIMFANKFLQAYFFTESTCTAKMLSKNFMIPSEKILSIGGGVDDEFIEKIREIVIPQKIFDACFIGRIHPTKGIFDLVHCWAQVISRIPKAKLAIVGGGYPKYRAMIEKTIEELNLKNNVVLCGYVSEEDKFRIMMQSKLLVHPAYEECIPLTFFEAASVNLPIITYYLPTYENVAECLIPVKKGDVQLLANTLIKYVSLYDTDKKAFNHLIEKEKELSRKHTWKNIARSLLSETVK